MDLRKFDLLSQTISQRGIEVEYLRYDVNRYD